MRKYEFKVVPVPAQCVREKHETGSPVAATLETALNTLGVEGWEFHRSESLNIKRGGFLNFGRKVQETVLVFRRQRAVMEDRPVKADFTSTREKPAREPRTRDASAGPAPTPRRITVVPPKTAEAA